jgi:hypothetical protein
MKQKENKLTTVTSVSGGKTSAYLMANYPTDYNIFSLVRSNDPLTQYKGDPKLYQWMCDKLNLDWYGTLEMDDIIQTIYDLEQFTGREITCVTGKPFEDVIATGGGMNRNKVKKKLYLPNKTQRFCTESMKLEPIAWWIYLNFGNAVQTNIGFRANEKSRAKTSVNRHNKNGFSTVKMCLEQSIETKRYKWTDVEIQRFNFPLIDDGVFKDKIEVFWKDKPIKFAFHNNCVGCFHRSPIFLRKMFDWSPNKMEWFLKMENKGEYRWRSEITYEKIKNHKLQHELSFDDFNECDSGYCGL